MGGGVGTAGRERAEMGQHIAPHAGYKKNQGNCRDGGRAKNEGFPFAICFHNRHLFSSRAFYYETKSPLFMS
jgi:hypothetical protein